MNRLFVIAVLCIAVQLGNATRENDMSACLREKGLDEQTDLEAIGEPDSADKLKNAPKDKLASVLACTYNKDIDSPRPINDALKSLINADNKSTEDQRKQMLDTLTDCNAKAIGDDEKLLQCVKIIDAPFAKLGAALLALPDQGNQCFIENGLNTDDLLMLKKLPKSVDEVIQHVDEDKLSCGLACVFEKERQNHPSITDTFIDRVNEVLSKAELPDDQRKSMMDTVQRCTTEAAKDVCKFMKCIKLFRPPFADVFFMTLKKNNNDRS